MIGTYNISLIALSIAIAVMASFVALDLASRVVATRGSKAAPYWLAGGAASMGVGIWAMHFIGMLSFSLPILMSYDIPITLCSLLVAMLASAFALHTVCLVQLSWRRLAVAGVVMGAGIVTMHYLGMEAMRMQPRITYDPLYFSLSVIIAVLASSAALWIAFQLRLDTMMSAFWKKFASALIMGAAIVGMHYTGMAAANFADKSICVANPQAFDSIWLAWTIAGIASLSLMTTLMILVFVAMPPTIRSRLTFLVICCVLPVSLLTTGFVIYDFHRAKAQLASNNITTARSIMAILDRDLVSVESGLRVLATSNYLVKNNYAGFYAQSREVLRELHANAITLSDASGQQLIDTRRPYGESLPLYEIPSLAKRIFETGKPVISDYFVGLLNSEPLIIIGVPVRRDGAIVHQISASILSDRMSTILHKQNFPPDWIVAIYDSKGTIVARSHEAGRFVGKKGAPLIVKRSFEIDEGSVETNTLEGIPVISAFSRSPISRWTVAIGVPINNVTSGLLQSLAWLLFALAVLLGGSIGLAYKIGNAIARSINALAEPAIALGTGAKISVAALGLIEVDEVAKALTKASAILALAQHQAQHDVLTGLANRALFNAIVRQQMMSSKRNSGSLAVLYIDLDGFKAINDTHGHEMGDALLREVATRIQGKIRECDLAARLGGDEFAVALVQPGMRGPAKIAGKLVESMSTPFQIGELTLNISASIGVAIYPESATTCEELLKCADEAMYQAKKSGKRRYVIASN